MEVFCKLKEAGMERILTVNKGDPSSLPEQLPTRYKPSVEQGYCEASQRSSSCLTPSCHLCPALTNFWSDGCVRGAGQFKTEAPAQYWPREAPQRKESVLLQSP